MATGDIPKGSTVRGAVVVEGGMALAAIALGWLLGVDPAPWAQISWSFHAVSLGLLATVPMLVALVLMTRYPIGPLKTIDRFISELLDTLFRQCSVLELLLISILAGFGEELLFRGAIQQAVAQYSGNDILAVAVASALFGLAHPITRTYVLIAALIGIYFGWLLLASENLLAPIIAHAAYDFVALRYLLGRLAVDGRQEYDLATEGTEDTEGRE